MTDNEYKNCPYCDEEIKAIAVKCRYCKSLLVDDNELYNATSDETETASFINGKGSSEKQRFTDEPSGKNKKKTTILIVSVALIAIIVVVVAVFSNMLTSDDLGSQTSETQSNLDNTNPKPVPQEITYTLYAMVDTDVLRLRSGPGTDYEIIDRLNFGTTLNVLEHRNEWLRVITPTGSEGWVHSDYVYEYKVFDPIFATGDYYDPNNPILIRMWTPGDEFWSDYGYESYWQIGQTSYNFSMRFDEIISLMGEPEKIVEELVFGDSHSGGYLIKMEYPYLTINFYYEAGTGFDIMKNDAIITEVFVHSPEVIGPRNIKVGDSFDSILNKIPVDNNPLTEMQYKYDLENEIVAFEQVLYGAKDNNAPYSVVLYNVNKEPIRIEFSDMPYGGYGNGVVYIYIRNSKIISFSIAWQYT